MKKTLIILIVLALVGVGVYFFINKTPKTDTIVTTPPLDGSELPSPTATSTMEQIGEKKSSIGKSVDGRDISAYTYGNGAKELLFIGGIHGGYEWNTVLAAYSLMDYLKTNPTVIPANVRVTVIPALNPDGLNKTVGTDGRFTKADVPATLAETIPGRFNSRGVDLNRNFDCEWQASGTWQSRAVSGGTAAFSEPESLAIKTYIETRKPTAAVVWYSAAGGVFASNCRTGVLPETRVIAKLYADASDYPAYEEFDFYSVTGDMVNWMAKVNVPAISVLLTNHEDIEWTKNQAGITALLNHYSK